MPTEDERWARALSFELRMLMATLHRAGIKAYEEHLSAHHVPVSHLQFGILRLLRSESATLSEISRRFGLDPSTLVPAVNSLVRRGLVRRETDPADRRRAPLSLTEEGIKILERVPPLPMHDALVKSLLMLGADKAGQLIDLLRAVVLAMPEGENLLLEVHQRVQTHIEEAHCFPERASKASHATQEPEDP